MNKVLIWQLYTFPKAKGRPRITRKGFIYSPKETRNKENEIKTLMLSQHLPNKAKEFRNPKTPLFLEIQFSVPRPKSKKKIEYWTTRPDLDNLMKLVLDAMNGIYFHSDAQIVQLIARKEYLEKDTPPYIFIKLQKIK